MMVGSALKRAFDVGLSSLGMVAASPILALAAVAVRIESGGPVLFRQERVGRNFKPFRILKFRTMVKDAAKLGPAITSGIDPRVTRVGRLLRKTKLDELPQLWNVLTGDMSLVGPRPEVRKYVDHFNDDYAEILRVRPGITDLASLEYRREEEILSQFSDPEAAYIEQILPAKIELGKEYVARSSLALDVDILVRTLVRVVLG